MKIEDPAGCNEDPVQINLKKFFFFLKELLPLNNNKNKPSDSKMGKNTNRHFSKGNIHFTSKHVKRC